MSISILFQQPFQPVFRRIRRLQRFLEVGDGLIDGHGFQPLCFGQLPPGITAILSRIVGTQELTVEAALNADRKLAVQALVAGQTARTEAEAEKMMEVILETHREYLLRYFD